MEEGKENKKAGNRCPFCRKELSIKVFVQKRRAPGIRKGKCPFCMRGLRVIPGEHGAQQRCPCKLNTLLEYRVREGKEFLAEAAEKMKFGVEEEKKDPVHFSIVKVSKSGRFLKEWS